MQFTINLPSVRPENLRSVSLSLSFLVMLGAGIGLFGLATGIIGEPSPPAEFDGYINLGARYGTEALTRDLNAQHPPGTDLVPLITRLQRAGFDCRGEPGAYACTYLRNLADRRVARIETTVHTDGTRVQTVVPVIGIATR
jgi:hypothetical protein